MSLVITQNYILNVASGLALPLNQARIGYASATIGNTPTVSSTASGFFAGALSNRLTHEFWKPTASPATVEYSFSNQTIDYLGIAAHSLGTTGTTVKLEYTKDNGTTWFEIEEFTPTTDNAVMVLFETVLNANGFRLTFTYSGDAPTIGVLYVGQSLVMQRPIYGGHTPITLARETINRPQVSESGQWIGASVIRRAFSSSAAWKHLTASWYRTNFDPFAFHVSKALPFFFAWNPDEWPNEVAYCWSNTQIKPVNMGIRDLMEVSLNLEGYGVEA